MGVAMPGFGAGFGGAVGQNELQMKLCGLGPQYFFVHPCTSPITQRQVLQPSYKVLQPASQVSGSCLVGDKLGESVVGADVGCTSFKSYQLDLLYIDQYLVLHVLFFSLQ